MWLPAQKRFLLRDKNCCTFLFMLSLSNLSCSSSAPWCKVIQQMLNESISNCKYAQSEVENLKRKIFPHRFGECTLKLAVLSVLIAKECTGVTLMPLGSHKYISTDYFFMPSSLFFQFPIPQARAEQRWKASHKCSLGSTTRMQFYKSSKLTLHECH